MPIASSGNVIASSTQLGADVVLTGAIKDGEIVNADLSATAAVAGSKIQALTVGANAGVIPSTGVANAHIAADAAIVYTKLALADKIVNADIKSDAAIVDTKLAQITTASKVSGAALTSLGSIPAGAGTIPGANLAAPSGILGAWANADQGAGGHQVATDCLIVGYVHGSGAGLGNVTIKTDAAATPTVVRLIAGENQTNTGDGAFCCPVKKGDYYNISNSGSVTVTAFIIPIGS